MDWEKVVAVLAHEASRVYPYNKEAYAVLRALADALQAGLKQ